MPPRPPSWSQGREFGVVIDAGSSGSRIQVYSWVTPEVAKQQRKALGHSTDVLSKVEKGVEDGDGWHFKVEPGISTFGSNPDGVKEYLRPLLEFARSVVPATQLSSTPIFLLATAGMRLLPEDQRDAVLATTCTVLQSYNFYLPDCAENVRVITGEEEGLYGWISVNYLMDGFDKHEHANAGEKHSSTYGFLDMGGASTQIAFEPAEGERVKHADNLMEVKLRLLSGKDVRHPVFVTTWLGFGTNQARDRYIDQEIRAHVRASDAAHVHGGKEDAAGLGSERPVVLVDDPCLPKSLLLSESRHSGYTLRGTGDFLTCVRRTGPLLNKEVECLDDPCLFNGVHVPKIDFSVNHFIGISEYWYSTQDVWSMGGMYDFVTFEKNAMEYCSREWDDIMADHKAGSKWRSSVELSRLETQCFKAAWIINILHEGIGIPRIIDHGGKGDGKNRTELGNEMAEEKGLLAKPPSFQSLNQVGDVAVSWTLGKMVLEVSKGTTAGPRLDPAKAKSRRPYAPNWTGHIPSFPNDLRTTLGSIKNADPLPVVGFVAVALFVYYFCLSTSSSRRRMSFLGGAMAVNKARRSDFGLAREEDGFSSGDSSSGSGTRSPMRSKSPGRSSVRRNSGTILAKLVSPVRYGLFLVSSTLRSWSRSRSLSSSGNGGILPTSRASTANGNNDDIFRPRPLRHAKSTPFMRVNTIPGGNSGGASGTSPVPVIGSSYYNDAPDVSERLAERANGGIPRSHSSNVLSAPRSTSPPPMSFIPSAGSTISRPTTPSSRTLTKRSTREDDPVVPPPPRKFSADPVTPPNGLTSTGWESLTTGGGSPTLGSSATLGAKLRPSKSQNSSRVDLPGYFQAARRKEGGSSTSLQGGDDV